MSERERDDPEFEALIHHIQQSRALDFRGYKRTSLRRRVGLRMQQVGVESFGAYQDFLEVHPQEFTELLNTVLINVTSFFRDRESWDLLRDQILPRIVERKESRAPIRIWSAGCASGQEPYSVAMLLAERLGVRECCRRVKIYATDLDEGALAQARQALYLPRDVEQVPPELRERYFELNSQGQYLFHRDLRKCVIFGRHNLVVDAPISRIDLLLCRNMLIYFETETQSQVLPRLHYALADEGFLFLGKAETQLARSKLFRTVEGKHRIFTKLPLAERRRADGEFLPAGALRDAGGTQQRLLEAIVEGSPVAYLAVELSGHVLFANSAARRLFDLGDGDIGRPFHELPLSYRPLDLRSRIEEVQGSDRPVRMEQVEFQRQSSPALRLTVEVSPLRGRDGAPLATLLAFHDTTRMFELAHELEAAQESLETIVEELQSANEELETTNEELQSTNEELETTNEELQSTNEELETMNEELHSTNEALELINEELRRQSDLAAEYRSHAESVLRSVGAGIVVLDADHTVRSWNRWNENTWGLRSDEAIGRPFLNLDCGLPVEPLVQPIRDVMQHGQPQTDITLRAMDRRGRTIDCCICVAPLVHDDASVRGAVIVVEDVTQQRLQDDYVRRLGKVLRESVSEIYFLEPGSLRFTLGNCGPEQRLGFSMIELRERSLADVMPSTSLRALQALTEPLLSGARSEVMLETRLRARDGREYPAEVCLQYLPREQPPMVLAIVHDLAQREPPESGDAEPRHGQQLD